MLRRLWVWERDGWISLARWIGRRPDVPAGGRAFAYRGAVA